MNSDQKDKEAMRLSSPIKISSEDDVPTPERKILKHNIFPDSKFLAVLLFCIY